MAGAEYVRLLEGSEDFTTEELEEERAVVTRLVDLTAADESEIGSSHAAFSMI